MGITRAQLMAFRNKYSASQVEHLRDILRLVEDSEKHSKIEETLEKLDVEISDELDINRFFLFAELNEKLKTIDSEAAFLVARILVKRMRILKRLDRRWESSLATAIDYGIRALNAHRHKEDALVFLNSLVGHVEDTKILLVLSDVFDERKKWDYAENAIFQMMAKNPRIHYEYSKLFYERIASSSDEDLKANGLSREEIEEALNDIERINRDEL